MIVMQKLKFMQEFIFEINVECQHSSLHMKISAYDAHIQEQQTAIYDMPDF